MMWLTTAVSCKEDVPYMTATPSSVAFSQGGGTQSISLSTNSMSWQASISGTGFSVSPASGAGNATLTLTAKPSTSTNDVTGTLTLSSGTLKATVTLTQSAKNTLIANGETIIGAEGGAYTVNLKYNTDYNVEVDDDATSWIQYNGTKAMSEAKLSFTVAANTGAERTGSISIKDKAGVAAPAVVTLTQKEPALRTALMALYNAMDGNNWDKTKSAGWASDKAVGQWAGVTLTDAGKVAALNLNGFGLKGTLPESLATFTDLTVLDLSANPDLSGNLPASWAALTSLTDLRLSQTHLKGTLPAQWAALTALTGVEIAGTSMEGPIDGEILSAWTALQTLNLSDNPFLTGTLPAEIGTLPSLTQVWLYGNNFTGSIPSEWSHLPEGCTDLQVYGNQLTEPVPLSIQGHTNWVNGKWDAYKNDSTHYLRTQQNSVFLELEKVPDAQRDVLMEIYNALDGKNWVASKKNNWNTDNDIATWGGVTMANEAIVGLNLNGFGLKGQIPDALAKLTSLTGLDLSNNANLTGVLPASMKDLALLREVAAHHTGMETPLTQEVILSWKHLSSLVLSDNAKYTGTLPLWLGNLTTDQSTLMIDLHNNNFTGSVPAEWASLPAACTQLLLYGNKLTGVVPKAILSHVNWTEDKWDRIITGTTHGIRSQQNGVYLDLEATLPQVSAVTVSDVSYNKYTLTASVIADGGGNVTARGFVVNGKSRKVGSGTGSFTYIYNSQTPNTSYTVQAYATNSAGTVYSPEVVLTTLPYSVLTVALADTTGETLRRVEVTLSRIGDVQAGASTASATATRKQAVRRQNTLSYEGTSEQVLRQAAEELLRRVQPYIGEIRRNASLIGRRTSAPRNYVMAAASASEPDYTVYTDSDGRFTIDGILPGTYSMRVAVDGHYPFYKHINVEEGTHEIAVNDVPIKDYNMNFVALYRPNTATRVFVSPVANDNVIALVNFDPSVMGLSGDTKLRQLVVYRADTSSCMAIVANSLQELQDTYEVMQSLFDSEGQIDVNGAGSEVLISVLKTHAQRIVTISGLPAQTSVINHATSNMKSMMFAQMDASTRSTLAMLGITEDATITIPAGSGFVVNMIMSQKGTQGTLMTDGQGPAQTGGNTLVMGSNKDVTSLSDVGYQGNWHIGIGVR